MSNSTAYIYDGRESCSIEDMPMAIHTSYPKSTWTCGIQKKAILLAISCVGVLAVVAISVVVSTSSGRDPEVNVKSSVPTSSSSGSNRGQDKDGVNSKDESDAPKNKQQPKPNSKVEICESEACKASAQGLLEDMDLTADPCQDFYQFSCGGYYDKYRPTNKTGGKFHELSETIASRVKPLLESEVDPDDLQPLQDFRNYYSTCKDTDKMDSLGIAPLIRHLNMQGGWPLSMDQWNSKEFALEDALAHTRKLNVNPLIKANIKSDFLNTSRKIFYISEGSLGLSSFILRNNKLFPRKIKAYIDYVTETAALIGGEIGSSVNTKQIKKEASEMVDFEIALAKIMDLKSPSKIDISAKTDVKGLQNITDDETTGQFDWLKLFVAIFRNTAIEITSKEPLYIYGTTYFSKLSTLLSTVSERTLANYLGWFWVQNLAHETTYKMRNISFNYNDVLSIPYTKNRESYCSVQTQTQLDFPVSRAYVDEYFSPKAKEQTTQLIKLIRNSFHKRLDENTWMAPADLVVAREKLDAIVDYVAYPDWIVDDSLLVTWYQQLKIVPGQHFDNQISLDDFYNTRQLQAFRISQSKVFIMSPLEINAFYDVFSNLISILAGILQPPFYRYDTLAALNLGGIGTVVGHEFTHGFDNSGRHFDKDGNLASWWSEETVKSFTEKSACFVEQYSDFYPQELVEIGKNISVNGNSTLGENIADNGGIRESFTGYMSYVSKFGAESRLPGLEQFSPEQLFFIGFSNVWCEYKTPKDIQTQINTDPHSPGRFRVIGSLSNSEDFAKTFNCPVGSPMNPGKERCVLW